MSKYSALIKRASNATAALALTMASLTPAVMLGGSVKAGALLNRSVTLSDSEKGATSSYTLNFDNDGAYDSIGVKFCTTAIGTCTAPTGLDTTNVAGAADGEDSTAGSSFYIDDSVVASTANNNYVVTLIDNPTNAETYFARITTYDAIGGDDGEGVIVDEGTIAISTVNELNVTAYVVEQLAFCVGSDATPTNLDGTGDQDECADLDGDTVDLGVVGTTPKETPQTNSPSNLGNGKEGALLVQTKAINGVVISDFSDGQMRAGGVSCTNAALADDLCFNNAASTLATGSEEFGMYKVAVTNTGATDVNATWNMSDADYGDSSNYKWNGSTTPESIMSSTGAVDWDVIHLRFGITASATTPSGAYSTAATFIATAEY
jgi:hypothetical protein